ncbi:unnamed protein product [Diatraea saccharalis]|uniref:Ketosynthase family 3 (KS3) domain-containing protein n=1 Tax=Diatraea saccharalis TaxID=40085 RepID=A0A9N9R8Z4_9NEOP|nr:unnamed protein product [Diatraea saccharalis]
MAPLPEEHTDPISENPKTSPEAVVISGISGLLPDCNSYAEFADKISKNQNLVNASPRWKDYKYPELPDKYGRITGLDRFDAQFFTVFYNLAQSLDPIAKKIIEHTYQAIYDAGVNPIELWGKNVAVFISYGYCESEKMNYSPDMQYAILGCCKSMTANRISYWLNLKGPSIFMDASSCGTLLALEKAREAIVAGYCEAAIVGLGKIVLHPQTPISHRMMPLNLDGKTKCYDDAADGPSMSEAISVFFLQKHKDAKRAYVELHHVKAHFGVANKNVLLEKCEILQDKEQLTKFLQHFYDEARVSPADVGYIEGFGLACPKMDKIELQAMENVFCKDRVDPLLVGSVSSNVGYTESAASACAIFKLISAYQSGELPATINCSKPRSDIASLHDGRMRMVTENTRFNKTTYTAVNAFTYTGINGHALLKSCYKPKDLFKYRTEIPYLVAVSGRHEAAVEKILDDIKARPLDPEEIALLHNIHKMRISKHLVRGIGIYSTKNNNTVRHNVKVDYHDNIPRPLWFVYSGMGSQWIGMGRDLMRIPIFNQAIQRCHVILEPKGIDLKHIITTDDKCIFDNILNCFVGIAAIQIGLTNVLTAVGMVPDNIIGHSVGELGCAYADGCFTDEQMLLLAYNRGLVSIQTPFIRGSMAAIGMGYKALSQICPQEIEVVCHNSASSSTISGPEESVKAFVKVLAKRGVFAKEVQCSNIPYHSRYIAGAGPEFLKMSQEVVKESKLRSSKWLSSSVPPEQWGDPRAKYSSAQYHTNNLLNKVLFEEVLHHVPSNAVLVEIAPHGLLQAILKRALSENCKHVPLTRRGEKDAVIFLLNALGNLYIEGYDIDISALYPKIEFPVSTKTRPLSHLVEWAHGEKWKICEYLNGDRTYCSVLKLLVAMEDDEYKYINGHFCDGVRVFPYAAALVAVWDTIAMTAGHKKREISIRFSDVKFYSQPPVHDHQVLYLTITVQRGSGRFEVACDKGIIIEGSAIIIAGRRFAMEQDNHIVDNYDNENLTKDDIYKIFYEKGFDYKDEFRSLHTVSTSMTQGQVQWRDNWVTFIDGVFQTSILRNFLGQTGNEISFIKKIVVDIKVHISEMIHFCRDDMFLFSYSDVHKRTRCGGVTIEHIFFKSKPLRIRQVTALQSQKFQSFFQSDINDIGLSIYIVLQIIAEYLNKNKLTLYIVNIPNRRNFVTKIMSILENQAIIRIEAIQIDFEHLLQSINVIEKYDVIILPYLLKDKKVFEALYQHTKANTCILNIGVETKNIYPTALYSSISSFGTGQNKVEFAILKPIPRAPHTTAISVSTNTDVHHISEVLRDLPKQHKLLVMSSYPAPYAVKDIVKHWRDYNKNISLMMFDQKDSFDKELDNIPDVPYCALQNNVWGNDYYVPTICESKAATCELKCSQPGNIDSLRWVEVQDPSGSGVEVTVHYVGLNVKDAKAVTGENINYSENDGFGMDFSGITDRGDRVMGLVAGRSASSKLRARPELLWPVPEHWNLEDAATVPLAYAHAFYCLNIKFELKKGMSILVHGGTGAMGQAIISIALAHDCRVFTTVSDLSKKRFLKKLFPDLRDDHIGNSRDGTFADMIKKHLKQNNYDGGCDLVCGYIKGELKDISLSCCGCSGYTVDITQLVEPQNFSFGMSHMFFSRSYSVTDFSSIFRENNLLEMRKLQLLMSEGIRRGYVRPLSRVTYEPHETPRAFRLLAGSRHRGRVLLRLPQAPILVKSRLSCTPNRSHLVVCDSDFGLQVADTLVNHGATKLYLHCLESPYVKHKIENWKQKGVVVEVSSKSIKCKEDAVNLLRSCSRSDDIEGVYVVTINQCNKYDINTLVTNLDLATRKLCSDLRYFAVISEDDKLWKDIIIRRARDGLPSLSLRLMNLQQYNNRRNSAENLDENLLWQNAAEAVEIALTSDDAVVIAYAKPIASQSILKEVAKIPGVNITNATMSRTTLEQIGIDHGRAQEVCNIIQQKFNITISKDVVPRMTIAELENIQGQYIDIEKDAEGFAAYFTNFDSDVMQATCELVIMRTLVHRNELRVDEFDVEHDYLCVIPGLEGHYSRFSTLCERLKIPAVVLQPNHADMTLEEITQKFANTIIQKLTPKRSFYLLGYDFGILVALEIASILETKGLTGTVFMLGGTPLDISKSFNNRFKNTSPEDQQNTLIKHMYKMITSKNEIEIENELVTYNNWNDKVECLVKKLPYDSQYTRSLIQGAYARIKILQKYNFKQHKLRSQLILIRAKLPIPDVDTLESFPKEMKVHNIRAVLAHADKDLACSNIVNKYLDKNIIEAYENSNQCDTVLKTDAFIKFMASDSE